MKFKTIVAIMVLFISNNAWSFDGLSTINIPISDSRIRIHYADKNSVVINKDITDESDIKTIRLIETKLNAESNERYIIDFCEGASWDPGFIIYRLKNNKLIRITYTSSLEITIPGDGFFYTSGHTNSMFNERKKFTIENGTLKEVKPPFYYVALDSKVIKDIDLYSDIDMSTVVERIKKGSLVSVLVNHNKDYYLIKTEYGLLGWIKIPFGSKDEVIEGIYYAGD